MISCDRYHKCRRDRGRRRFNIASKSKGRPLRPRTASPTTLAWKSVTRRRAGRQGFFVSRSLAISISGLLRLRIFNIAVSRRVVIYDDGAKDRNWRWKCSRVVTISVPLGLFRISLAIAILLFDLYDSFPCANPTCTNWEHFVLNKA